MEPQYKQAVKVCAAPFQSVSPATKAEEIRAGKLGCERREMKSNLNRHGGCAHAVLTSSNGLSLRLEPSRSVCALHACVDKYANMLQKTNQPLPSRGLMGKDTMGVNMERVAAGFTLPSWWFVALNYCTPPEWEDVEL